MGTAIVRMETLWEEDGWEECLSDDCLTEAMVECVSATFDGRSNAFAIDAIISKMALLRLESLAMI